MRYYVQVEAVNLDDAVYDTHDVSTIRGGSFMLLNAIKDVAQVMAAGLEPIATAASIGLFAVEARDPAAAQAVLADLLARLRRVTAGYATFLGSVTPADGDFNAALERLSAAIRRQQWRSPTVIVPPPANTAAECYIDGWRPATVDYRHGPGGRPARISAATHFRREAGRTVKNGLFAALLDDRRFEADLCTADLGALATHRDMGVLNGKIAFIHVDGNKFGRIRRELCTDEAGRRRFDDCIQHEGREPFLRALLETAREDPDFQATDERRQTGLRLEVLMWGGDEFTLVVPAWKGLQTVQMFFSKVGGLTYQGRDLSHRLAVVFCHHNAPILQIRRLAAGALLDRARDDIQAEMRRELGEDAEKHTPTHRQGDALRYLVLESFDMLQGALDDFLGRYYAGLDASELLVHASELPDLHDRLRRLTANLSKGRLLDLVDAIQHRVEVEEPLTAEWLDGRLDDLVITLPPAERTTARADLAALTDGRPARWRLLAEWWDYAREWQP